MCANRFFFYYSLSLSLFLSSVCTICSFSLHIFHVNYLQSFISNCFFRCVAIFYAVIEMKKKIDSNFLLQTHRRASFSMHSLETERVFACVRFTFATLHWEPTIVTVFHYDYMLNYNGDVYIKCINFRWKCNNAIMHNGHRNKSWRLFEHTHTQTHRIETAEIISLLFELIKNSSTNKS